MSVAPAVRRSAVRLVTALAACTALAALYGSWLPFEMNLDVLRLGLAGVWSRMHLSAPHRADAIANIAVYVPLGLLLGWRGLLLGRHWLQCSAATVLIALAVAILAEGGQALVPVRDPSLTDLLFNLGGALAGLLLARPAWYGLGAAGRRLRLTMAVHPLRVLLWIAAAVVAFAKLAPFDLTLSASDLQASLIAARWNPLASARAADGSLAPEAIADVAGSFFAFVLLGVLAALAHRERGSGAAGSVATAIAQLGALALTLESLQLVIASHTCDMADAATYLAGAVCGALFGATTIHRRWRDPATTTAGTNPALRCMLGVAMAVQAGTIAICAMPPDRTWVAPAPEAIRWLPFSAHLEVPFAVGVGRIISSTLWYLALAILAVLVVPGRSMAYTLTMSSFLTVGVVTLTEGLQAFTLTRHADITEPLLAAAAALLATWMYWTARRWHTRHVPPVQE